MSKWLCESMTGDLQLYLHATQFTWVCESILFIKSSLTQDSYQTLSNHGNSNTVMVMCTRHLRQARQDLFVDELDVEKLEAVAKVIVMNSVPSHSLPMIGSDHL